MAFIFANIGSAMEGLGTAFVNLTETLKEVKRELEEGDIETRKIALKPPAEVPPMPELESVEAFKEALPNYLKFTGLEEHAPVFDAFNTAQNHWQTRLCDSPEEARVRVFGALAFTINHTLPRLEQIHTFIAEHEIADEIDIRLPTVDALKESLRDIFCTAVQTFDVGQGGTPIETFQFNRSTIEVIGLNGQKPPGMFNKVFTRSLVSSSNNCWIISLLQVIFNNPTLREHLIHKLPEGRFIDMPSNYLSDLPDDFRATLPDQPAPKYSDEERQRITDSIFDNFSLDTLKKLARIAANLSTITEDTVLLEKLCDKESKELFLEAIRDETDTHQLKTQITNALYSQIPDYTIIKRLLAHYEVEQAAGREVSVINVQLARTLLSQRSGISKDASVQEDATEALTALLGEIAVEAPPGLMPAGERDHAINPLFALTTHTKKYIVPEGATLDDDHARIVRDGMMIRTKQELCVQAACSLPNHSISFEDLLEEYFSPTKYFIDNPLQSGDTELAPAGECRQFTAPPPLLIVDVKRFDSYYSRYASTIRMRKKHSKINVPSTYYLRPEHVLDNSSARYELSSFIEHKGAYGGGHYVSYLKRNDEKWYECDDEKVTEVTEEVALAKAQSAYTLFFKKTDDYTPDVGLPDDAPTLEERRTLITPPHDFPQMPESHQADILFALGKQFLANPTKENLESFPVHIRQKLAEISWIERKRPEESETERMDYIAEHPESLLELTTPYYAAGNLNIVEQLTRRAVIKANCSFDRVQREDQHIYDARGELEEEDKLFLQTLLFNSEALERAHHESIRAESITTIAHRAISLYLESSRNKEIAAASPIDPVEKAILIAVEKVRKEELHRKVLDAAPIRSRASSL